MLRCGLIGEKLGHSYSPEIHAGLCDYEYRLYEPRLDELDGFLTRGDWDGLNVTIPYKKAVVPYCATLSNTARALGSVNTLLRRPDGSLHGDNTDFYGFSHLLSCSGISVAGKKALVLGSGGTSVTVCAVLKSLGAAEVIVISRSGEHNYQNLDRHADAQILVNTTPVGMFPKNGQSPVALELFPRCEGVLDVVYNPARTALLLAAEQLHIPCRGGLTMLVAQAARSCELFTGHAVEDGAVERIERTLRGRLQNLILIGMPGCGKSTVAALLGKRLGRPVYDADALIAQKAGMPIPEIFARDGEDRFRSLETQVLQELGKGSGAVIATGGGCVTRAQNYPLLHQNGTIFWLQRDLKRLPRAGRPLSLKKGPQTLYDERRAAYARFADFEIDNNSSTENTVSRILEMIG